MRWGKRAALAALLLIHLAAAGAGFLAPYEPSSQYRGYPSTPPSRMVFGDWELRVITQSNDGRRGEPHRVRWFHHDESGLHLFGVSEPGKIFLLGTDPLGRDQFSRLLHGARISLFSGIFAALLAAFVGTALGLLAGYYSGWVDRILMKVVEVFLALPWLYLLLGTRAVLPLDASPAVVLVSLLGVLALVGWARPARLVRGLALSIRERHYVTAARGFGAGPVYVMRRHMLPGVRPTVIEYICLAAPQFVLAEVTLSFLGLGLGEPVASWGTMLAAYSRLEVMASAPWMAAPAVALSATSLCYHALLSSGRNSGGGRP